MGSHPSNPNQPNVSLDYPDYEIDWNTSKLKLLPKIELDEDELKDFLKPTYSPADFKTIKASRELEREISWLLFSFNYLNDEFRNFYALDKHGLTIWSGRDHESFPKDAIVELLFFNVSQLRRIFFPDQLILKKSGSLKRHFPEFSLLAFLNRRKEEIGSVDRSQIKNYLDGIDFEKFASDFDEAGSKSKHHLIFNLYKDQESLPAILNDLEASGVDMSKILDVTYQDFFYLVSNRYGSNRTLQDHFKGIKSCLQDLRSGKIK